MARTFLSRLLLNLFAHQIHNPCYETVGMDPIVSAGKVPTPAMKVVRFNGVIRLTHSLLQLSGEHQ